MLIHYFFGNHMALVSSLLVLFKNKYRNLIEIIGTFINLALFSFKRFASSKANKSYLVVELAQEQKEQNELNTMGI